MTEKARRATVSQPAGITVDKNGDIWHQRNIRNKGIVDKKAINQRTRATIVNQTNSPIPSGPLREAKAAVPKDRPPAPLYQKRRGARGPPEEKDDATRLEPGVCLDQTGAQAE